MIKNKYKSQEIIKSKKGKVVEKVICIQNNKRYVLKSYPLTESSSIENQLEVYQKVKQPHLYGIPQIKEGFQYQGRLYLTFQELGPNIQYLRIKCGGRLSLKTTLMIGIQMLERIQFLHENGFLHGDIKPSNFLIGLSGKLKHKIYLVDFQLSHPYTIGGKHIEEKTIDNFSGCLRFCSCSANNRKNICRKDQIQSLIYTLIYLIKGQLPWMNIQASNISEAYTLIGAIKMQKKAQLLQGLPQTFKNLIIYVQDMKFKDKPNYGYVKVELINLMKKNGYELDYKHDWEFL